MRVAAVVPTYRHLATLPTVVDELERAGFPVVVVDDGSGDGTAGWLRAWVERDPSSGAGAGARRSFESFPVNRGKGAALAAGLARARALGFEAAVTVDSDAQHLIEDTLRLAGRWRPGTVICGARQERVSGYPAVSLFGRRLWALGVRSVCGLGVSDPVCGLRVYPLVGTEDLTVRASRYAWEEEYLVRASWAGLELEDHEITTVYQPAGVRISHYARWDWINGLGAWAWLALLRIFFIARCARPRGSLAARDRSWRRVLGCAVAVAVIAGAAMPAMIAVPLAAWLAWRLYAPVIATTAVALLASWASGGLLAADADAGGRAAIVALAALPLGVIAAKAARPLCSS